MSVCLWFVYLYVCAVRMPCQYVSMYVRFVRIRMFVGLYVCLVSPDTSPQIYAAERGWEIFAVQYSTQCFTAPDAGDTYQKYGVSTGCNANGRGGTWCQDVYRISCDTSKFCHGIHVYLQLLWLHTVVIVTSTVVIVTFL